MKLCESCRYRNNTEYEKPCVVYRDDCEYYEKERGDMSGDLISRQAVDEIKELMTDINGDTVYAVKMSEIRQLPSVNPQEQKWIPVSERLPEICEKDCHGDITFSKTVIATQIYGNGYVYVGNDEYTTNNGGGWLSEVPFDNPDECCEVIAWMPLPEPYKAESEDKE